MAKANQVSIPYVDPSVQHVGISRLRALNVTRYGHSTRLWSFRTTTSRLPCS